MTSACSTRVALLRIAQRIAPERPCRRGSLGEIGDALVPFGDRQQPNPDLGKSRPRRLLLKSNRLAPIAMRVENTGLGRPPPGTQRLGSVMLNEQLMSFSRFTNSSRSLLLLCCKLDGTVRHCSLTLRIVKQSKTVNMQTDQSRVKKTSDVDLTGVRRSPRL